MLRVERRDSENTSSSLGTRVNPDGRRDKWKERLNTELLKAVSARDVNKVRRLLDQGASADARCRKSWSTASHLAADLGEVPILKELIEEKEDVVRARDKAGRQPHHLAAASGEIEAIQFILGRDRSLLDSQVTPQTGVSVPPGSLDSWNHNHEEISLMMPDVGIGQTALHVASAKGHWEMVRFLLGSGADPNVLDMNGLSPLDVAGQNYEGDTVADSFVRVGGDGASSSSGIVHPIENICNSLIEKGACMPKANVIVKDGIVINQRRMNVTALHTAVLRKDQELTRYLLERGACPIPWNKEGQTAVHLAIKVQSEHVLRVLLSADRNAIEARDVRGMTPLLQSVEEGWQDGVALLLELGADVTATSNCNQTVLHLAAQFGRASILEELLSIHEINKIIDRTNATYETPLCLAVKKDHLECVKLLCQSRADAKFLLLPGDQSLLHIAVRNNSVEILQCLLRGPGRSRIDVPTKDEKGGMTPLQVAALEGNVECADELIASGANLRLQTKIGNTALHFAAKEGHLDIVRLLIKHEPSIMEIKNNEGWNPLHTAAAEGRTACAKEMILHGADISETVMNDVGEVSVIDIICSTISNPVDFLDEILTDFIDIIRGPVNDPECEILLNFDVLMPDGENEKQMTVIGAILNNRSVKLIDRLMLHPLIETFLYLKWNKFKFFFIVIMLLYLIMTISLTTLAYLTFVEKNTNPIFNTISFLSRIVLFIVLLPIIAAEVLHLSQLQRYYFTDYESWVKWSIIVSTVVVEALTAKVYWVRYLSSVAVLMSWIEMLFLLSRCPSWGFYVLMFARVSTKIIKILTTFSFLILGFSFSFLILFEAKLPFPNLLGSIIKVFVMMFEFDYEDMFQGVQGYDGFSVIGRVMFAIFVLLVAMVMMNLIVGVAVSDIARLEEQGRTQQLEKQAGFLSFLEIFLYSRRFKALPKSWRRVLQARRSVQRSVVIRPGRPSSSDVHLPRSHIDNILFKLKTRRLGNTDLSASLQDISDGIDRVAEALNSFYSDQKKSHLNRGDRDFEMILKLILEEQRAVREQIQKSLTKNDIYSQQQFRTTISKPTFQCT